MAKPKLTREMVAYIINLRDDVSKNYTFNEIEQMLFDKFGVKVSYKSIHKAYHKYKDDINHISVTTKPVNSILDPVINNQSNTDNIKLNVKTSSDNSNRLASLLLNSKSFENQSKDIDLDNFEIDTSLLNEIKDKGD